MTINTKEENNSNKDDYTTTVSVTEDIKDRQGKFGQDPDLNHFRELLLEARKNAESAKATVTEVMTSIYSEKPKSKRDTENPAEITDENTVHTIEEPESSENIENICINDDDIQLSGITPDNVDDEKTCVLHRMLSNSNNPLNAFSGITRSILFNKSIESDASKEFSNLITQHSKQLRQFIDNAIEEQSRKRAAKIVERAKSEIAASQVVVSQAQREVEEAQKQASAAKDEAARVNDAAEELMNAARKQIKEAKYEIEKAHADAEEAVRLARESVKHIRAEAMAEKKSSEVVISQVKQETMSKMAEEIKAAKEEVAAMKEELRKNREGAESKIHKVNDAVIQASHDIVRQTREEIARTRHDIEQATLHQETRLNRKETTCMSLTSGENDTNYITTKLHEMRAPLDSISGFARLMLEDNVLDNVTRQEFLSVLVQKSDILNRLLDNLTGNLAAGTCRLEMNRTPVSPNELINDVIQSMRNAALEKDILIGSTIPDTLPAIEADISCIRQVLINLIDNALKYNEGNSTIIIKTQVMENELMILVEDHGIGIPEGEALAIFDDYYRASNHGNKEGQGLGLGICKKIVESHRGNIQVESVEGVGSTFSFTLPLAYE